MGQLLIGWGQREVSTTEPVLIPGQMYMRLSEGIHDPLFVTALCLDSGEDTVIFCTADVVVFRGGIMQGIREKVHQLCPQLPEQKIIMGATHTHADISISTVRNTDKVFFA